MSDRETTFREIVATHGPALRRVCRGHEADPQQRAELEQDLLLAIWHALPSFRGEASLRTFVLRVAHNTAIRHISRAARRPKGAPLVDTDLPLPADQDRVVHQRRQRQRLFTAIRALKPLDRELILLHLEGLTHPEVAEVTGLSPTNISTRLSRARAQLKDQIGGHP